MARVQRPPIKADIGTETPPLHEPLRTVVTSLAERLERAEPELVDVTVMWLDVVADFRRRDDTALETERNGCSRSWCLRIRAQRAVEYHLPHFVGWPRTPIDPPAESSRWNVSLRLAVALAWPAEPGGVAQPGTRRRQGQIPLVLVACSRARHAA